MPGKRQTAILLKERNTMLIERTPVSTGLILLSIILVGVVGCAPQATQPVDLPTPTLLVEETQPVNQATPTLAIEATQLVDQATATPLIEVTLPSGWEMYTSQGQCGYSISHPQDMDITSMVPYSWSINFISTEPSGPDTNFVYVSVIPGDFQDGPGVIYNYDPAATERLLSMQVGESRSEYDDPNLANFASWYTYTRLPDTTLSNQTAQTYENTQPGEFPLGTKEIRYYLQANGCTYMIGGYMTTVDSGEPRAISQELFDQIIATFRVNS
jgi:hypothetical protein